MSQSQMLLVQPLNLDEINFKLKDEPEELTTDEIIIDDLELLNILLPSLIHTAVNSPIDEECLLDWDDMPEDSINHKRKREDEEEFDVFAQLDFVDAIFPPLSKKQLNQENNKQ